MPYRMKNGKWRSQVRMNGKTMPTKVFDTKKEATAYEIAVRSGELNPMTDMACLAEWAVQYLDFSKQQYVKKTYKQKVSAFRRLLKHFKEDMPVTNLTKKMVLDYKIIQAKERTGNAANKDFRDFKAGWTWGTKYMVPALPTTNPFEVEEMAETQKPRYIPPIGDFWKVFELCNAQDKALLLTYLYTTARKSEIFRLTWADLDFNSNVIRLSTRKRANGSLEYDMLPMSNKLAKVFEDHLEQLRASNRSMSYTVFADKHGQPYTDRNKFLPRLCKQAGVEVFGFHGIRHLTATALYHDGCSLAEIQRILRHKSPKTTELYLQSLGVFAVKPALDRLANIIQFPNEQKEKATSGATYS